MTFSEIFVNLMMQSANTQVTPRQEGETIVAKQMEGEGAAAFPGHRASLESVLVVIEGQCTMKMGDTDHTLKQGDSFLVPPDVWHQVIADPAFKAVHVMPKGIRFDFRR